MLADSIGGSFGVRGYNLDRRSNLTSLETEDQDYTSTLGSSPFVDQMTQIASDGAEDILKYIYTYNHSGSVATKKSANDSTSSPSLSYELDEGPGYGGSGASETVFRAIGVNGNFYNYYYDGRMHRRAKAYPAGDNDEYWYAGDQLIEDQGNLAQVYVGAMPHYHPIDDYVWLGGRPVVIVHGSLNGSDVRMADDGAHCSREGDGSVCGKYFPVTDHIGKPVLMLDGNQKVAGVGEYDPYGQVNRVSLDAETGHNYSISDATIADFTQPAVGGTNEDVRVKLQMVDLRSGNWSAHCGGTAYNDSAQLYDPNSSSNLGSAISGAHTGGVWSDWVTPSAQEVQVNLVTACAELQTSGTCSCSTSASKTGLVMEGYDYRRYESGASPFWTPLRFPGQYHDDESDLNQNWNRFYDAYDGRYVESEPRLTNLLSSVAGLAEEGLTEPVYAYASNNPIMYSDSDGDKIRPHGCSKAMTKFLDNLKTSLKGKSSKDCTCKQLFDNAGLTEAIEDSKPLIDLYCEKSPADIDDNNPCGEVDPNNHDHAHVAPNTNCNIFQTVIHEVSHSDSVLGPDPDGQDGAIHQQIRQLEHCIDKNGNLLNSPDDSDVYDFTLHPH